MEICEIEISYKPKEIPTLDASNIEDAHKVLRAIYNEDTIQLTEEFIVLYLSRSNKVKGWRKISTGGLTGTLVDIRLILAVALKSGSVSIILSHNHPSGNLEPSESDILLTDKIKKSCQLMDIRLLDHFILSKDDYMSFSDKGLL